MSRTPAPVTLKEVTAEHGREMFCWSHAIELAAKFPYCPHELQSQSIETLRVVARLCKSRVHHEVVGMNKQELVMFILSDQPQKPFKTLSEMKLDRSWRRELPKTQTSQPNDFNKLTTSPHFRI